MFKLEEAFACFGDEEDAFVFTVGEIFFVDGGGVAEAKIDFSAGCFIDPGGKGNAGAWGFDAVVVGALAVDVGGVGEGAPWIIFELVPLFDEVVAAVVTDGFDELPMNLGDAGDMGCVDDEFAAVGQNGFEFVHALSADPEFVVHGRGAGEDGVERFRFDRDMDLSGEFAGLVPSGFGRAGEDPAELGAFDDEAEGEFGNGDESCRAVNDPSDRRPFVADDFGVGDDRAEPVEEVEDLGTADAGEEVFVAAGETDDFMREDGADDDELIVVEGGSIDLHGDIHGEESAGEFVDFVRGNDAELMECGRCVPCVVDQVDLPVAAHFFAVRNFETLEHGFQRHGRVGAESEDDVEG